MYVDLTAGFWVVSLVLSVNTVGKSNKSVFIMADLKSLWPITLLVIIWSMAFAEYLVTHLVYLS